MSHIMFFQVSLNVLDNGIESLHIYIRLANNIRDISLIFLLQNYF